VLSINKIEISWAFALNAFAFLTFLNSVVLHTNAQPAIPGSKEKLINRYVHIPKILFLGDSLLAGYLDVVEKYFENNAEIHFSYSRNAIEGQKSIKIELDKEKWELIYVAWGINDVEIKLPNKELKGEWGEEGGITTTLFEYEDSMRKIAEKLVRQNVPVVWASIPNTNEPPGLKYVNTTWGVEHDDPDVRWYNNDIKRYNDVASTIAADFGFYTLDLYKISQTDTVLKKARITNTPYYSECGYQDLGLHVSAFIENFLASALQVQFNEDISVVLDTDIGPRLDIDDWFDVMFYAFSGYDKDGIVMEHYATNWVETALASYLGMLGTDIPYAKGSRQPIRRNAYGDIVFPQNLDGGNFILERIRESDKPVRLVCVGALTNVAIAYLLDSAVFMSNVESVWFNGGVLEGENYALSEGRVDANVNRDKVAADVIFNSKIPLVWAPVSLDLLVRSDGMQENRIRGIAHPVIEWLYNGVDYWRHRRGRQWELKTGQTANHGRRLWALPMHAIMNGNTNWVWFEKGVTSFSDTDWTGFRQDNDGNCLVLRYVDKESIQEWYETFLTEKFVGTSRR